MGGSNHRSLRQQQHRPESSRSPEAHRLGEPRKVLPVPPGHQAEEPDSDRATQIGLLREKPESGDEDER